MERNKILMKEKLGFHGLLKEVTKIFYQNPKFIILSFLTSLPLLCCMLIHELWLQKVLSEATMFIINLSEFRHEYSILLYHDTSTEGTPVKFIKDFGPSFLQLGLMYFPFIHLPDLITTIVVVSSSSDIYSGEKMENIKETLSKSFENGAFKRTLITSIYVLLLASLVSLGLLAMASNAIYPSFSWPIYIYSSWSFFIYGIPFVALLYKYMQWSSLWNLGIVTSILEEKRGYVALGVSAYVSRSGNRRPGEIVTAMFFVWNMSLRLMAIFYVSSHQRDERTAVATTAFQVLLVYIGNVIKWVIFMVFFYDCKLRFLEKKVDVEEGKKADAKEGKTDKSADTATTS